MFNRPLTVAIAAFCLSLPVRADDQTPDTAGGRYTLNKVADGFIRLDTQTGEVTQCSQRTVGWACQAAPEDRDAYESEMARLRGENAALKQALLSHGLPLPSPRQINRINEPADATTTSRSGCPATLKSTAPSAMSGRSGNVSSKPSPARKSRC